MRHLRFGWPRKFVCCISRRTSILVLSLRARDVNKDLTPKDQDKDKDLTLKDKDKDKNLTPKDKDLTPKDQEKDKDLKYVFKVSLRTMTRTRTTA